MSGVTSAVRELLSDGFAFIDIDSTLVTNATLTAQRFLRSFGDVKSTWTLTRPGEDEPDVGVIVKSKQQGFDEKVYLHLAHDLPVRSMSVYQTRQQIAQLRGMYKLHDYLKVLALTVASELSGVGVLPADFAHSVANTFKLSEPYNVSALRFLSYPDMPEQTGAKEHYDKGWLSIHLGDDGGELWAMNQKTGRFEMASPPPGMALLFFGVKMLYLTEGKLKPVLHKSTTIPGKDRSAAVMFVHADVGFEVRHAKQTYDAFFTSPPRLG